MRKTVGKKGFTLIELMVVVALVCILAAILYPVFARAREKARQSSCQTSLKQVVLASLMYTNDNDGKLPVSRIAKDYSHFSVTREYWKNDLILYCPSFYSAYDRKTLKGGYGANSNLQYFDRIKKEDCSKVPLIADTRFGKQWFQTPDALSRRHDGCVNIAFCDGHVRAFRKEDWTDGFGDKVDGFENLLFDPKIELLPTIKPVVEKIPRNHYEKGDVVVLWDGSLAVVYQKASQ